jgi:aldose 1-epimerase
MSIQQTRFGRMEDGKEVELFTLKSDRGLVAKIANYGGRITELHVPDRSGKTQSIVLGFETLEPYLQRPTYFGCIAGRYANRIRNGRFELDGQTVQLVTNDAPNTLHGGKRGFDKVVWDAAITGDSLVLNYLSPNGDQGFPGNLHAQVTYTLAGDELQIQYAATTDAITVVNLTNHTYFNLAGAGSGEVLQHEVMIKADRYTPHDEKLIPLGKIASVKGTPLDFRAPRKIGERIGELHNGYDDNLIFEQGAIGVLARVRDEKSGRVMEMQTDQPAVQFYSAGHLDGTISGIGGNYVRFGAFCLETQHYPDSPNHPDWPSTLLRPGEKFQSHTSYRFLT